MVAIMLAENTVHDRDRSATRMRAGFYPRLGGGYILRGRKQGGLALLRPENKKSSQSAGDCGAATKRGAIAE